MNTNCEELILQATGPVPTEALESYRALKDTVELYRLQPEEALAFLVRIFDGQAGEMERIFSESETGPLTFSYLKRLRKFKSLVTRLKAAEALYFTAPAESNAA